MRGQSICHDVTRWNRCQCRRQLLTRRDHIGTSGAGLILLARTRDSADAEIGQRLDGQPLGHLKAAGPAGFVDQQQSKVLRVAGKAREHRIIGCNHDRGFCDSAPIGLLGAGRNHPAQLGAAACAG